MNHLSQKQLWATVCAVALGWLFSAVDVILLILFQEEIAHDLGLELQSLRVAIGVGLLGSAFGGLFFAQLGDRWGRVKALASSIILYSLATGLMAFTQSKLQLFGLRFIAGIGTGAEWSIGFALLSEVWSQKSRGRVGGMVASMFNIGTFLAIALFQSSLGWRSSFAVMCLPAFFALGLRKLIPESQLWLRFQKAKQEQSLSEGLKLEVTGAPIKAVLTGQSRWITYRLILLFTLMNLGFYSFSTVFINFLKASVEQGGLALDKSGQLPFQLLLNLASLVSVILAGSLSDRLGRKKASMLFCLFGLIGFLVLSHQIKSVNLLNSTSVLMFPFTLCCVGFGINGVMGIFAPELFATHLRSTGPGLSQNLGKGLGGMLGPPLAGTLVVTQGYSFVLSLPAFLFILMTYLIYTLPEVGGKNLHDEY